MYQKFQKYSISPHFFLQARFTTHFPPPKKKQPIVLQFPRPQPAPNKFMGCGMLRKLRNFYYGSFSSHQRCAPAMLRLLFVVINRDLSVNNIARTRSLLLWFEFCVHAGNRGSAHQDPPPMNSCAWSQKIAKLFD